MKVFSTPAPASALETWLRDVQNEAEVAAGTGVHGAVATAASLPELSSALSAGLAQPARDTAEGLLDLNVWNGAEAGSRRLISTAPAPDVPEGGEPLAAAQRWAEHIFQSLLLKPP
jgi:hypothetical protein